MTQGREGRVLPEKEAAELKELREIQAEITLEASRRRWYSESAFITETLEEYCNRYGYEVRISAWVVAELCNSLFV